MKESITTLKPSGYKSKAVSRSFKMEMDRPLKEGGTNEAPTPVEYLLTAIGGCVAMTLKHFVDRKQWDVGSITVKVTQKEELTPNGIEKQILEDISIEKEITEDQKKKLLLMASKCPIAQMIKTETRIETKII